jgi:hypothetical protein
MSLITKVIDAIPVIYPLGHALIRPSNVSYISRDNHTKMPIGIGDNLTYESFINIVSSGFFVLDTGSEIEFYLKIHDKIERIDAVVSLETILRYLDRDVGSCMSLISSEYKNVTQYNSSNVAILKNDNGIAITIDSLLKTGGISDANLWNTVTMSVPDLVTISDHFTLYKTIVAYAVYYGDKTIAVVRIYGANRSFLTINCSQNLTRIIAHLTTNRDNLCPYYDFVIDAEVEKIVEINDNVDLLRSRVSELEVISSELVEKVEEIERKVEEKTLLTREDIIRSQRLLIQQWTKSQRSYSTHGYYQVPPIGMFKSNRYVLINESGNILTAGIPKILVKSINKPVQITDNFTFDCELPSGESWWVCMIEDNAKPMSKMVAGKGYRTTSYYGETVFEELIELKTPIGYIYYGKLAKDQQSKVLTRLLYATNGALIHV